MSFVDHDAAHPICRTDREAFAEVEPPAPAKEETARLIMPKRTKPAISDPDAAKGTKHLITSDQMSRHVTISMSDKTSCRVSN